MAQLPEVHGNRRPRIALASVLAVATITAIAIPAIGRQSESAATSAGPQLKVPDAHSPLPEPRPSSRLLGAIQHAFKTMNSSLYAHRTRVDTKKGSYNFDCVLMISYFLKQTNPQANREMRQYLHTRPGRVPSPTNWARFFASLNPAKDTDWHRVVKINDIKPGDIIIKPPANPKNPGHALVVAAVPKRLPNGNYEIMIFDSTSSPHGNNDTRVTDPRNQLRNGKPSGLGMGVIELTATADGGFTKMKSTVGGKLTGLPVLIARPLR